jgi:hypothetical protein
MTSISTLPLAQQIDHILQASGKERVRLLCESPHIATIVPLLPPGELWLTVGEVGKNDALLVMENATSEQWQTLFDLAAWTKDELDFKKAIEWLHTMVDVDASKASAWFRDLDHDFSTLLVQHMVSVAKKTDKEEDPVEKYDWPQAFPPWTLDGHYYLQGKSEDLDQLARALFRQVADDDIGFYHHLCDVVMDVLPTEQTETAFETRERRLAEEGFPPYEEAIAIYQPLSPQAIKSLPKRESHQLTGSEKHVTPRYPLVICDNSKLFISQVMAGVTDGKFLQDFAIEVAGLTNKVMIADNRPMEPQELRESATKVVAMINLGLEAVSGHDVEKAHAILQSYWARDLFKVGVSLMRKLPLSKAPQSE